MGCSLAQEKEGKACDKKHHHTTTTTTTITTTTFFCSLCGANTARCLKFLHKTGIANNFKNAVKAVPLQAFRAPRISRQSAHEGGNVFSPKHWLPLPLRDDPWYLFLLQAESTPGPQCCRKD